jgi:Copper binding proteins, plastocyanin/azurin family
VLQATRLVQRGDSDTINFTAPSTPGEYNYLCTFPGHWVRMYGVMVVVQSLDAFEARPAIPNDPMTGNRYGAQRTVPGK